MNADRFEALLVSTITAVTRRAAVRVLGVIGLTGLVGKTDAKNKKNRKKKCAKAGQSPGKNRKHCCKGLIKDGTGRCAASCTPVTCPASGCGNLPDGCGGTLSCGCDVNSLCLSGACQPCDVCASGCRFNTVQAAIAASSPGATVTVCAGIYTGDLLIDKSLTLRGAGDGTGVGDTILQGSGTTSVMRIQTAGPDTISLQRLRITGGVASAGGGGIFNAGSLQLSLTACTVTGNTTNIMGGGILHGGGTLSLTGCTISENSGNVAGGIYGVGTMNLTNSTVRDNTVANNTGGIYNGGMLTLDASEVTGNRAPNNLAGGIYNSSAGAITLLNGSSVKGNRASPTTPPPRGGGIFNEGMVNPVGGTISENSPDDCVNINTGMGCPPP